MALPPTPLTSLLNRAPTPDAMYDLLEEKGWLSTRGRRSRRETVALISGSLERRAARDAESEPFPGPTPIDELARELLDSPYLNSRGALMGSGHVDVEDATKKSWWQLWK